MTNSDNVEELITRYLAGESSADEENRLLLWISQSDANRQFYHKLKKTFDLTTSHVKVQTPGAAAVNVDHEWNAFKKNIDESKRTRLLTPSTPWLKIAASLLLVAVTGAILYYVLSTRHPTYQTADNTQTITLPDGSVITMNRFTTVSVDGDYGNHERTVTVEGEAFFDVMPDGRVPFVVLAEDLTVQVVGTSFNVMAYDSSETVEVVVETGIVMLQPKNAPSQKLELLPGQRGVMSKADQGMSIAVNKDANFLAWNTHHLVFVDADLVSVVRTLEKVYNVKVSLPGEIPPACTVTVTFDKQTLESVMRVLESTWNLEYTINDNQILIREIGC